MNTIRIIFSFWRYRKIKAAGQYIFDSMLPIAFTALLLMLLIYLKESRLISINVFGDKGLIDRTTSFLQFISGFFITSLSAIVALNGDALKKVVKTKNNENAFLVPIGSAIPDKINVDFKIFLSYMFGYLTCLSFLLFLAGLLALSFAPAIASELPSGVLFHCIKYLFITGFFGGVFCILFTTLYGVYFMVERLNWQ